MSVTESIGEHEVKKHKRVDFDSHNYKCIKCYALADEKEDFLNVECE